VTIEKFIDCFPPTATAQHKSHRVFEKKEGGTKLVFFEAGKVKAARAELTNLLRPFAPEVPLRGPLQLVVVWTFYWSKGEEAHRESGKIPEDWRLLTARPDGDNLAKMFKDVMQALGYYANDSHVSVETFVRGRGDRPGIHFALRELDWTSSRKWKYSTSDLPSLLDRFCL